MWKKISHISNNLEINNNGKIRYIDSKKEVSINYSASTGYYEVNLKTDGYTRHTRRNVHFLVARYFLNDGKPISKEKKVIFKDGDFKNFKANNLEIVGKYEHITKSKKSEKRELFISYGDEIFC